MTGTTYASVTVTVGNKGGVGVSGRRRLLGSSPFGTLYCGAFKYGTVLTSVSQVRSQGFSTSNAITAGNAGFTYATLSVTVTGLTPSTLYTFYCAFDEFNAPADASINQLRQTLGTRADAFTACCRPAYFVNPPGVLVLTSASVTSSVLQYSISYVPTSVVFVTPIFFTSTGLPITSIAAIPSTTKFTNSTLSVLGSFAVTGSAGTYFVGLNFSGADAAKYSSQGISVTLLSTKAYSTYIPPAPILTTAQFSSGGGTVQITFDTATNTPSF